MIEITYNTLARYAQANGKNATARTQDDKNFIVAFETTVQNSNLTDLVGEIYDSHWTEEHIARLQAVVAEAKAALKDTVPPAQSASLPADTVSRWMGNNAQGYHRSQGVLESLRSTMTFRERHRQIMAYLQMFGGAAPSTQFGAILALVVEEHIVPGLLDEIDDLLSIYQHRVKQFEFNQDVMSRRVTVEVAQMPQYRGTRTEATS